jgi:hypothetical protein
MTLTRLVKGKLSCQTYLPSVVRILRKKGWVIKLSKLGELI